MKKDMTTENATAPSSSNPRQMIKKGGLASKIFILLIVIFGGAAVYFYTQYATLKADPNKTAKAETAKLVSQVSRLIVLPTGEDPTVATVTDLDKLKDQPFFAHAKNGDKVLIYTQAKKAILFDPVANKIVEVAPINIGDSTKTKTTPAPATTNQTTTTTDTQTKAGN